MMDDYQNYNESSTPEQSNSFGEMTFEDRSFFEACVAQIGRTFVDKDKTTLMTTTMTTTTLATINLNLTNDEAYSPLAACATILNFKNNPPSVLSQTTINLIIGVYRFVSTQFQIRNKNSCGGKKLLLIS